MRVRWYWIAVGVVWILAVICATWSTSPAATPGRCVSRAFAVSHDTAYYETWCVGGAKPDSVVKE